MSSKNVNLVKEINLNKLRSVLKREKISTKPQLAELIGLSVVTINSLVATLIKSGEIIEDKIVPSGGGRPAVSYRFNEEFSLALVIYMHENQGKDTAYFTVCNLYGEVLEKKVQDMNSISKNSFDSSIGVLLEKYPNIKVITFGMPGEEIEGKMIISDYEGLRDESLTSYIKEKFKLPCIFENDINAAIEGYCYYNDISYDKCVIGIYFPSKYPPGAGVYINGDIYKGRNGLVGEIKYMPFDIQWDNFDYNEKSMKEIIIKMVLSFSYMYNPDTIVLYGDIVPRSIKDNIKDECKTNIEKIMMPEIIVSTELNKDYEIGIKQVALKFLEPTLKIN